MNQQTQTPHEIVTAFRASMRRLAGGVALLTTEHDQRRYGMTMTAVMSLTMEPPALVIAVNTTASISNPLLERGRFCINLLGAEHDDTCRQFSALPSAERFAIGDWRDHDGLPYLAGSQASIFCTVGPITQFGTHALITGVVDDVLLSQTVGPLIHVDGQYVSAAFT